VLRWKNINTELSVREFERKILPRSKDIANVHSSLLEFNELLKTRTGASYGNSVQAKAFVRGLRARKALAQRQLLVIEADFDLLSSQPLYDGKTFEHYLEIANTARNADDVNSAYIGVAELRDQFDRREDFVAFVQQAIELQPSVSNLFHLIKRLKSKEFNEIVINLVAKGTENQQRSFMSFLSGIQNQDANYLKRLPQFSNLDPIYEAMISKASKPANRLINYMVTKLSPPKDSAIREKLEAHLQELLGDTEMKQQREAAMSLVILKPTADGLAEQARQIFAKSKKEGFYFVRRFPAGSTNARKSIPLLFELIESPDEREVTAFSINGRRYPLKPWEFASIILGGYGDSVLDAIEIELRSCTRSIEVVLKMLEWRNIRRQTSSELKKLLERQRKSGAVHKKVLDLIKTLDDPEDEGKNLNQWLKSLRTSETWESPLFYRNGGTGFEPVLNALEKLAGPEHMNHVIKTSFEHLVRKFDFLRTLRIWKKTGKRFCKV